MSKLFKFMALPWQDKRLYFETTLWLIAVKVCLYFLPFDRLREWINISSRADGRATNIKEMHAIIRAIERIASLLRPLRINCLPQALVGRLLLGRKGFDVQLKIGVSKTRDDQLAAHAWLEYQGQVMLGNLGNLGQFIPFPSLEGVKQ